MRLIPLIIVSLIVFSGCSSNKEDLELLQKDDDYFRNMVAMKSQAEFEIAELKDKMAERKKTIDGKVRELRESYAQDAGHLETRIRDLREKIAFNRARYRREIAEGQVLLAAKQREAADLEKAMGDLNDVLDRKGTLGFSPDELQNWQDRKATLDKRIATLNGEIQLLETEKAFKERKLQYL